MPAPKKKKWPMSSARRSARVTSTAIEEASSSRRSCFACVRSSMAFFSVSERLCSARRFFFTSGDKRVRVRVLLKRSGE